MYLIYNKRKKNNTKQKPRIKEMLIYHYPRKVNPYKAHIHNIPLLGQTVTPPSFYFKLYLFKVQGRCH